MNVREEAGEEAASYKLSFCSSIQAAASAVEIFWQMPVRHTQLAYNFLHSLSCP